MRSEGVYSSSLSTWRRQREAADLAVLAPQKRGPKLDPHRAESLHIAQLTRERDRLKSQLDKALGTPAQHRFWARRMAFVGPLPRRLLLPQPPLALDAQESKGLLEILNSERFFDLNP